MTNGENEFQKNLHVLKERIARASGMSAAGQKDSVAPPAESPDSAKDDGTSLALRVPAELIAGLGVGYFIGSFLDNLLETRPFFTMMCLLLGMAGALLNIYKALR